VASLGGPETVEEEPDLLPKLKEFEALEAIMSGQRGGASAGQSVGQITESTIVNISVTTSMPRGNEVTRDGL